MRHRSGRRVDQLLRAEFLHSREVEQRVDAISRAHSRAEHSRAEHSRAEDNRASVHEAAAACEGRLKRSVSWPGKSSSSSGSGLEQVTAPEAPPARRRAPPPKAAFTSSGASSASTQPVSLPPGPPSSYESSTGRSVAEQPVGASTLTWMGGSWLKTMIAGGRAGPAPHAAPAAEMSFAAGGRSVPEPCLVAQVVVGVEESSAVDAFFGQDLVTEALAELATKEDQAVVAEQVRLGPVPASEGDMPFQVRAAQHAAWVAGGDEAATTRRGDESPGHGSSSSEISASHSSAASVHSTGGHMEYGGHSSRAESVQSSHSLDSTPAAPPPPLAAAPQSQQLGLGSLREKLATHVMCVTSRPGPRRSCRRANGSRTRSSSPSSSLSPRRRSGSTATATSSSSSLNGTRTTPPFAGVEVVAWCKLLKDKDTQPGSTSMVSKFSFEYTPSRKRSLGQP